MSNLQHFKKDNPNVVLGYGQPEIWDNGYEYTNEEKEYINKVFGEIWYKLTPQRRYQAWRAHTEYVNSKS